MTDYLVLRKIPESELELSDPDKWEQIEGTFSGSPRKVCKEAAAKRAGTYVAVPVRSWNPLPVKVETRDVVTIG